VDRGVRRYRIVPIVIVVVLAVSLATGACAAAWNSSSASDQTLPSFGGHNSAGDEVAHPVRSVSEVVPTEGRASGEEKNYLMHRSETIVVSAKEAGSPPHPDTIPASGPPSFNGHYYAGSVYSGSSESVTDLHVELQVPNAIPDSSSFYYVILSVWDNAGSYDQIGFSNDYGTWGLTYSTTSYCAGTYYYDPDAQTLNQGQDYLFEMSISSGYVDLSAFYASNATLVWSYSVDTGATSFQVAEYYSCDSSSYYDYTDYEEVYQTAGAFVPYDLFFTNNSADGSLVSSWSEFLVSAPSGVYVLISGANVTIVNVLPTLVLSPNSGAVGSTVAAQGTTFAGRSVISFTFEGVTVQSTCSTNSTGSFPGATGTPCTFIVPPVPGGTESAVASDGIHTAMAQFTVESNLMLSPRSGVVGSHVAATGTGFAGSSSITFTFAGVAVASTCSSDSNGSFPGTTGTACTFTVPAAPGGNESVVATSSEWVTFPGVDVGSSPLSLAFDSGRGEVFVANSESNNVSVINDTTNKVIAWIYVGGFPNGIAYDPGKGEVFVANEDSDDVSVISDTTNEVVATVPVGAYPIHVAYDSGRSEVFVTNSASNNSSVISDATNKVVANVALGYAPDGVAYDSGKGEVFVANFGSNNVSVISDATNKVVATVPVGDSPAGGVAYDSGRSEVFVANVGSGNVSVISDSTNAVVHTIAVGYLSYGAAYDLDRGEVFVTNSFSNNVSIISDTTNRAVNSEGVGVDPSGIAYDSSVREVFVANVDSNNVSVLAATIATTSFKVLGLTLGLSPTSGVVGSHVAATGTGFAGSSSITFTFAGVAVASTCSSDSNGSFPGTTGTACTFTVPAAPGGNESVVASDGTNMDTAAFTVNSSVVLPGSPSSVDVGQSVVVHLSGFGSSLEVSTFTLGSYSLNCTSATTGECVGGAPTTDSSGSLVATFIAPSVSVSGSYLITVADTAGNSGTAIITVYTDPTVATPAASPGSVDVGQAVTFSVTSSGGSGGFTYAWSGLPTGCASSGAASDSCTPTGAGTFTVTVVVTDSNGLNVTSHALLYGIDTDPTVGGIHASRGTIDVGQTVTFTTSASGGSPGYTYAWSGLPTGCTSSDSASDSCTPTGAGTFSVAVSVTDSNGWTVTGSAFPYSIDPSPTAAKPVASSLSIDIGQSFVLTTTVGGGSGSYSYSWFGLPLGCLSANASSVTCTPTGAGTLYITVNVTDSNGFAVTSQILSYSVYGDPTVSSFGVSPESVLQGNSATFATATTGGRVPLTYSYLGLPAGCSSANVSAFTCAPSATGTFTVEVIVLDANGFKVTRNATLTVDAQVLGLPAAEGYAVIGGGIALVAVVAAVVSLVLLNRRKRKAPHTPFQPQSSPPQTTQSSGPPDDSWSEDEMP
jgi:YVTN family beta-propeller protein